MSIELVVTRNFSKPGQYRMEVVDPDNAKLEVYKSKGGYQAIEKAVTSMSREEVMGEVKTAKLLGRGGAGFPAGVKWGFTPQEKKGPHYVVINADEGEPGTFKDRYLMEFDPHAVIEGALICAFAVQAERCYIYIRGEFSHQIACMDRAIQEA